MFPPFFRNYIVGRSLRLSPPVCSAQNTPASMFVPSLAGAQPSSCLEKPVVEPKGKRRAQQKLLPGQYVKRCHWPNRSSVHNGKQEPTDSPRNWYLQHSFQQVAGRSTEFKAIKRAKGRNGCGNNRIQLSISNSLCNAKRSVNACSYDG
jgi:hypothetical protein